MNKLMTHFDSRAIAKDINQPPFTELPFEMRMSIKRMFGNKIMTFDEYIVERDKKISAWGGRSEIDFPIHKPKIENKPFGDQIKEFIHSVTWTYAKTMPEWPHEYIVRHKVDRKSALSEPPPPE